uniref:Peptidase A1 domain-containing protein n=1 Tax=Ditylenchus dipsaci TaxID=166011 RepID=A0A915CNF4_9BILA
MRLKAGDKSICETELLDGRSRGTQNIYSDSYANISVGTPAQTFLVYVDFFGYGSLILIDSKGNSNTDSSESGKDSAVKNTFNTSDSSTFTDPNYNFTSWFGDGHVANDTLALSGTLKSKVEFGLLDSKEYFLSRYSYDGYLGLAPPSITQSVSSDLTSVLDQLADVLDEPVITIWTNNTRYGNGSSVVTIGAIDSEHCESNWIHTPQNSKKYYPYTFHVSSAEMTINGTNNRFT